MRRHPAVLEAYLGGAMLKLTDVVAGYGPLQVLRRVSLEVQQGEIVCLLGGNAAGKSTTLKTVLGLLRPSAGSVALEGERIDRLATEDIVRRGIALVPESRRIFARMTVWENLAMGAYSRRGAGRRDRRRPGARVWSVSRGSRSARASMPAPCRAESSRCWRSGGR